QREQTRDASDSSPLQTDSRVGGGLPLVTGGVTRSGMGRPVTRSLVSALSLSSAGTSSFRDDAKYLPYAPRQDPAGPWESSDRASKSLFTKDLRLGPVLARSWLSVCLFQRSRMRHTSWGNGELLGFGPGG